MTDYDDLFAATTPEDSVFADKAALDPLAEPDEVVSRDAQQRQLATLLNGITEGYLPTTVSIHGPPGTGKTLTTRRVCQAFAQRHDDVAVEYVNLKECRSLFAAANELHLELTGEKKGSYEGLDGIFEGIWDALSAYPAWTVVILDEIDHIQHDSNYDPSDFFYRLLRGEGKLKREIQLSAWLISNELLEVDLRVDSRVESAMSDDEVFFPPYDQATLAEVVAPQLEQAFRDGALPPAVREYGVQRAADRWGGGGTHGRRCGCSGTRVRRRVIGAWRRSRRAALTPTSRPPTKQRPSRNSRNSRSVTSSSCWGSPVGPGAGPARSSNP
jgi:cell division control protein 6